MKRRRRLRKLVPDAELIRRRAAGEPLRELASDYDVVHTTLGRYFKRPEVAKQRGERGGGTPPNLAPPPEGVPPLQDI